MTVRSRDMRMTTAAVVLVLSACTGTSGPAGEKGEKGDRGDVGPAGAQGPKGDPGTSSGGLVLVDADGTPVPEGLYIDTAGVQWPVNLDTGQVYTQVVDRFPSRQFLSNDCSGSAYVDSTGLLARQPFSFPDATVVYVRGDAQQSVAFTAQSVRVGTGPCTMIQGTPTRALKVEDCTTHPKRTDLPLRGPLRWQAR